MLLISPTVVLAQSTAAVVRGTVTDPAGAAVAGATVRLVNEISHYSQETRTDAAGAYSLVDVPLNRYALVVEAGGFEPRVVDVTVSSNVARRVDARLEVAGVRQEAEVRTRSGLLDPEHTGPRVVVDRTRIFDFPTAQPSRATEEIVSQAPGWTLDANGRLHARGIEYQVQYSVDGIPVTDTIASTFAASLDPRNFRSAEIVTANIPAEFGNKVAGVVDVTTRSGLETAPTGRVTISGGSFSTGEISGEAAGHHGRFGYFVSGAGSTTDRFLAPPAEENFHNYGDSGKGFAKFDFALTPRDLLRLTLSGDAERFDVPNLPDQEDEGQDQRRRTSDVSESLAWDHTFSSSTAGYLALFHRYDAATLRSNFFTGPVWAEQSRHQSNYGAVGSVSFERGRHLIKAGGELLRFPVTESFTFAITDLDELLEKEPDLPEDVRDFTLATPFLFRDHAAGWEGSLYVQDHLRATDDLTLDLGLRFDSYHFLVDENFVSPRVGAAYFARKTGTVLRASYNRFMETPALENLLLSSSEEARIFSPGDEEDGGEAARRARRVFDDDEGEEADVEGRGAPVRPSREHQVDVGFQQQLGSYVRLDVDGYYRWLENPPEIVNFLETGIIFPATLDHSRSKGVEARLDLASVRGFSGFASYTNLHIWGYAPITGGLFLGEAIDLRERLDKRVNIEEDQRNTAVFQLRYDYVPEQWWFAFGGRHDSGFGVELEPEASPEEFEREFSERILDRVDLERGFVKPHTVFDVSIGKDVDLSDHVRLTAQFDVRNIANTFHLITFESVFSGTTLGLPRTYSGKVSFTFK